MIRGIAFITSVLISTYLIAQKDTIDCPLMYTGFGYVDSLNYCVVDKQPEICVVKGYNRNNQLLLEYSAIPQNPRYKQGPYTEYYSSGTLKGTGKFEFNSEAGEWIWRERNGNDSTIYSITDGIRIYKRKSLIYNRIDRDSVYHVVDDSASFPGGPKALQFYILKNLVYPEGTLDGLCEVSCIVNTEGTLTNIRFLKRINADADQLVVELIRNMPRWEPATVNGKKVRSVAKLSFNFYLKKQEPGNQRTHWSR